ncbi:ribonucleotide reductase inhibitor-domain-containing protein [Lineolata rhizophorae]|uniref:Ribonucleotide reductase inhibitor-domain-containing protein n=1 Tax=Lineolata rhizophorae TaxID=578093 RepID=A0A6A6PD21_9PEZI|nr:ribonucleotide reductase inhibitor-domain-containing protein [Lineolata rhizophorae]
MASTAHRAKRPFQPSITSFFDRAPPGGIGGSGSGGSAGGANGLAFDPRPHHHHNHFHDFAAPQPALPAAVQSSLLNVGMRVRKSVPEGYKTHKTLGLAGAVVSTPVVAGVASPAGMDVDVNTFLQHQHQPQLQSGFEPEQSLVSQQELLQRAQQQQQQQQKSSYSYRPAELVPFCGLHKTGGLDVTFSHGSSSQDSSFPSNSSNSSIQSSSSYMASSFTTSGPPTMSTTANPAIFSTTAQPPTTSRPTTNSHKRPYAAADLAHDEDFPGRLISRADDAPLTPASDHHYMNGHHARVHTHLQHASLPRQQQQHSPHPRSPQPHHPQSPPARHRAASPLIPKTRLDIAAANGSAPAVAVSDDPDDAADIDRNTEDGGTEPVSPRTATSPSPFDALLQDQAARDPRAQRPLARARRRTGASSAPADGKSGFGIAAGRRGGVDAGSPVVAGGGSGGSGSGSGPGLGGPVGGGMGAEEDFEEAEFLRWRPGIYLLKAATGYRLQTP